MKAYKFILPVIIVAIIFLIVKIFTPEPTDWKQSYSKNDKIPYGSYILYEQLNQLFPVKTSNQQICRFIISLFKEILKKRTSLLSVITSTLMNLIQEYCLNY